MPTMLHSYSARYQGLQMTSGLAESSDEIRSVNDNNMQLVEHLTFDCTHQRYCSFTKNHIIANLTFHTTWHGLTKLTSTII